MSQFAITPTAFGQQAFHMLFTTYAAGNRLHDRCHYLPEVQNGISTGLSDQIDPTPAICTTSVDLAALTHVDGFIRISECPTDDVHTGSPRPTLACPYIGSRTQNAFCTFGGPDQQQMVAKSPPAR